MALSLFLGSHAFAQIRLVDAPTQVNPQTAFGISVRIEQDIQPSKVELLYRSATTGGFRSVIMAAGQDGQYRGSIPAADVISPGVELYVQLTRSGAKVYTDPPQAPAANIYFVQVTQLAATGKPSMVKTFEPAPNAVVLGRSPSIKAVLSPEGPPVSPGRVVANIDGIDVTAQLEISHEAISIRLASALLPGQHQVVLTFLDAMGQPMEPVTWSFTIRDYELLREGALATGFTWNSEYSPDKVARSDPNWKTSANFNVQGKAAEGAFEATADGNLRWIDQERGLVPGVRLGEMSLVNGLLSFRYDKQRFELGDLAIAESPFTTGASFPRRGMKFSGEIFGTQFGVFGVRPEPVTGWVHVNGVNHSDNRIQGGSVSRGFFGEALRLKAVVIDGKSETPAAFNTGNVVATGAEGTTLR